MEWPPRHLHVRACLQAGWRNRWTPRRLVCPRAGRPLQAATDQGARTGLAPCPPCGAACRRRPQQRAAPRRRAFHPSSGRAPWRSASGARRRTRTWWWTYPRVRPPGAPRTCQREPLGVWSCWSQWPQSRRVGRLAPQARHHGRAPRQRSPGRGSAPSTLSARRARQPARLPGRGRPAAGAAGLCHAQERGRRRHG